MLWFPGTTSDYVESGDISAFEPGSNPWTMYMQVLPLSGDGVYSSRWQNSSDRSFLLSYDASGVSFNILGTDNNGYGANNWVRPPLGQWSGLAAMSSGGGIKIWSIGGMSPTTGAVAVKNSSLGNRLGNRVENLNPYKGYIAYVATWTAVLNEAELSALDRWASPLNIRKGSLTGYWAFNTSLADIGTAGDFTRTGSVVLSGDAITASIFDIGGEEVTTGPPIDVPFLNIGTGVFAPAISDPIVPPFLNIGVGLKPVYVLDGETPPFVPPSLPPTIPPGTPTGPGVPLPPLSSGGLAGIRFYQGPPWRWLVTDLESQTLTFLDRLAKSAQVTYVLNKGWTAKLTVPSDNPEVNILADDGEPFVTEGTRLLYGFRREGGIYGSNPWKCRFAGKILMVEDVGYTEDALTTITAFDSRAIVDQMPMVTYDFEFPDKAGFFSFDDTQYGVMLLTFLRNAIVNVDNNIGIDVGDQDFATVDNMPGTAFWGNPYDAVWSGRTKSLYETTTQVDTDFEQGLMVGEVWDQILQSGAIDIMLTPIYDPYNRPGMLSELSIYERIGVVADDAVFAWDKPGRNVTQISSLKDGTKRANTIRYYWDQGGPPVGPYLGYSDGTSILKYGETYHEQSWPARLPAAVDAIAQLQLLLMADGIHTVQVTPTPERMPFLFTEWFLGDTTPVFASNKMRQEIAGFQRVYGIVLDIDENSYEQVPQVLVSANDAS